MTLYLGCHLPAGSGYLAMGKMALAMAANTFQFFTRNPRGGRARALDLEDIRAYNRLADDKGLGTLVAHAPYTMNLCSDKEAIREFASRTMREDLERLQYLDRVVYNFHPGSHVGQGLDRGIALIVDTINQVLTEEIKTPVLLETMAGRGSEIGRSFHELARIIDGVTLKDKVGVCLDTCHLHAAGYDLVAGLDRVLDEFDGLIGLERLGAVHLNDSQNPAGSGKDRHAGIGEGTIGLDAIIRILRHPKLKHLPFVLETPRDLDGYAREIKLLRQEVDQACPDQGS